MDEKLESPQEKTIELKCVHWIVDNFDELPDVVYGPTFEVGGHRWYIWKEQCNTIINWLTYRPTLQVCRITSTRQQQLRRRWLCFDLSGVGWVIIGWSTSRFIIQGKGQKGDPWRPCLCSVCLLHVHTSLPNQLQELRYINTNDGWYSCVFLISPLLQAHSTDSQLTHIPGAMLDIRCSMKQRLVIQRQIEKLSWRMGKR